MSPSAAPPSAQEISRKLSVHSVSKSAKSAPAGPVSGTESESDSGLAADMLSTATGGLLGGSHSQPPLSSIAERHSGSGEDSEDEEDAEGKSSNYQGKKARGSPGEGVIKAGYLWKKGERRKTWKKRWFVLRPAHLAYYKTSAEYELLRLLDLAEVHSCTQVNLKKHEYTFGLVSPVRTFYLQAKSQVEVQEWVTALEEARQTLMATSTQNSIASPIPISNAGKRCGPPPASSPPGSHPTNHNITSSDSDDPTPLGQNVKSSSPQNPPIASSPIKSQFPPHVDPAKTIIAGYLMKCGSKRRNWRKRWFVLNSEKLMYSGSHMDTKHQRTFPFTEILDALEYDLPANRHNVTLIPTSTISPPLSSTTDEGDDTHRTHTFKIVTTKRTLLLCAPSEEEEIKWLGAIRALTTRRSGAGIVPGDSGGKSMSSDITPSNSGGLKGKARKMSISGEDALEKKVQQ